MGRVINPSFIWAGQAEGIRKYVVYKQSEHWSLCSISDSPGSLPPFFFLTNSHPSTVFFPQRPFVDWVVVIWLLISKTQSIVLAVFQVWVSANNWIDSINIVLYLSTDAALLIIKYIPNWFISFYSVNRNKIKQKPFLIAICFRYCKNCKLPAGRGSASPYRWFQMHKSMKLACCQWKVNITVTLQLLLLKTTNSKTHTF